jgi:hypothetical protein
MGMFDSFYAVVECPNCHEKAELEFQTKTLGCMMRKFRPDDKVKLTELVLKEAEINNAIASCPKCEHHIKGTIWIYEGMFVGVKDIRLWEIRS